MNQGLRKTHFILGSDPVNYLSTIKEQNQAIDGFDFSKKVFNISDLKKDLGKSHFSLGNEETAYKSENMTEFVDKSKIGANKDNKNKGKELRRHNYILGEDIPDYISQNKLTYTNKELLNDRKALEDNKKDLQANHYRFGYNSDSFNNLAKNNFAKVNNNLIKPIEISSLNTNQQNSIIARKTNFILGEFNTDFQSVNSEAYVPHQLDTKNLEEQKQRARELRSHHFTWGNDDHKINLATINREDYKNKPIDIHSLGGNGYLRSNHFSIGDSTDNTNIYQTSYNNSIGIPKDLPTRLNMDNNSFKTTYFLKTDEKPNFLTETKAK